MHTFLGVYFQYLNHTGCAFRIHLFIFEFFIQVHKRFSEPGVTSVTFVIIIPSTFQLRISISVSLFPKYEEDSANPTTSLFVFCWTMTLFYVFIDVILFVTIRILVFYRLFLANLKLSSTFKKYCVYVNVSCLSTLQSISIQRFYCIFRT